MPKLTLLLKIALIGLIALLLQIPVAMIRGLVLERQEARNGVLADIARGTSNAQRISGPVIYIPWTRRSIETITSTDQKDRTRTTKREKIEHGHVALLPASLAIEGRVDLQEKHRGIYTAHVYTLDAALRGTFELPASFSVPEGAGTLTWGRATLVLGIRDTRGIRDPLELEWDGAPRQLSPGSMDTADAPSGVHADLGMLAPARQAARHDFRFKLALLGTQRLDIVPLGASTTVTLSSPWPHPSFTGSILPDAGTTVSAQGFSATWRTSHFATSLAQLHQRCTQARQCDGFNQQTLAVSFIQPVDLYQTVERSVKYGFLFILLTFAAFFLFEMLRRLSIHPVQYALVGVALALFFLLLISLSEHIGFLRAYAAATAACAGLIGYYVAHVLQSLRRGAAFALALACLYALLYVILRSEDHALLMGSMLVFVALAATMVATRRLDWYALTAHASAAQAPAAAKPA
jgi:inner membrane protein